MKTKRIDFNIDLAKKIQAGEAQGRIVIRDGQPARVICWDRKDASYPIVALIKVEERSEELLATYTGDGSYFDFDSKNKSQDLCLEVPEDTPTFKPYDKVLVRDKISENWKCDFFSHYDKERKYFPYMCVGDNYTCCIPYEGNEHLVGTTDELTNPRKEVRNEQGNQVPGQDRQLRPRHHARMDARLLLSGTPPRRDTQPRHRRLAHLRGRPRHRWAVHRDCRRGRAGNLRGRHSSHI